MEKTTQNKFHIYCDGGIGNRINALISGLAIANYFNIPYIVNWPVNNWCHAEFHDIFQNDFPIINQSLQKLRGSLNNCTVMLHDEIASNILDVRFSSAYSYDSLQDFEKNVLALEKDVFYYPALIPNWIPFNLINNELEKLEFSEHISASVRDFISENFEKPYHGLHLRRTDLNIGLTDEEVIKICSRHPNEMFFVCSDDLHAEDLAASFPNVRRRMKSANVIKRDSEKSWTSETKDDDGRMYYGNIVRPKDSIIDGMIDLLILAHSQIVGYSGSTFQRLAQLIGDVSPIVNMERPERLKFLIASEIQKRLNHGIINSNELISLCHQLGVQGDIKEATLLLENGASHFHGNEYLDILHALSIFHINQSRPKIARCFLTEITTEDPNRFSSWLHLALAHHLLEDFEQTDICLDYSETCRPFEVQLGDEVICQYLNQSRSTRTSKIENSNPTIDFPHIIHEFGNSVELEVEKLKNLLQKENPVILEIGANCGQTTAEFLKFFPQAKIYCFEPDPRAIEKFKRSIHSPNVRLIEAAIGAESGQVIFNQSSGAEWVDPSGWDHSGSIRKPKSHLETWPWVTFENQIVVPMMKLDDWVIENGLESIDFIWADVQGAEGDLIAGASRTLKITDYFYTEFSDDEWYEGQINFDTLQSLLENFSLLKKFKNDALFYRAT